MEILYDPNKIDLVYFYLSPILFSCSMYGWSQLFFLRSITKLISLNIVIGMGLTLSLGGILNVLGLANHNSIKVIFFFGLVLFFFKIYKSRHLFLTLIKFKNFNKIYFYAFIPLLLFILNTTASINPEIYNYHDDFQKYFLHPVKMLETGSIFGSKLSAVGNTVLGGQAFFQSFFVSAISLKGINIFDSVFCLSICLFLILEWSAKKRVFVVGILISLLIVLVHPQYVNISSIYSSVLFILSSIIFSLKILQVGSSQKLVNIKFILALGICFASMFILKPINALFIIIYFILLTTLSLFFFNYNKYLLKLIFLTPFFTILISLPWLVIPFKNLINALQVSNKISVENLNQVQPYFPNLISSENLLYGATQLHYTSLVLAGIFFIILSIKMFKKKDLEFKENNKLALIVGSSSLMSGLITYLILMLLSGLVYLEQLYSTRYSIPFIIATIPSGLLILYTLILKDFKYLKIFSISTILFFSIIFLPQYIEKIYQSYKCNNQLSFESSTCEKNLSNYNKSVFNNEKIIIVREWQKNIPKGEAVMVWINTPFYLDFKRNKIFEIDINGIGSPWAVFPTAKYMIWEYNSFATRKIKVLEHIAKNAALFDRKDSIKTLKFIKNIQELSKKNKIELIKDDGSAVIFKLNLD